MLMRGPLSKVVPLDYRLKAGIGKQKDMAGLLLPCLQIRVLLFCYVQLVGVRRVVGVLPSEFVVFDDGVNDLLLYAGQSSEFQTDIVVIGADILLAPCNTHRNRDGFIWKIFQFRQLDLNDQFLICLPLRIADDHCTKCIEVPQIADQRPLVHIEDLGIGHQVLARLFASFLHECLHPKCT